MGEVLDAEAAEGLALVTFARDDIDWDDEVRVFLEERAWFSADALDRDGGQPAFCRARNDGNQIFGG